MHLNKHYKYVFAFYVLTELHEKNHMMCPLMSSCRWWVGGRVVSIFLTGRVVSLGVYTTLSEEVI
jgi:hypothetical protein